MCHLRPATACGRDTRHISDLTPPPHDITPDTDTHTAFYSHGFGVIFTGDRSQLQSLYMTFSHVWRGTILRSLNDFRLTYACTVLYLHTPYPVPVSPSQVSSCHVIALCGTSRYKRRADWASDAAESARSSAVRAAPAAAAEQLQGRACRGPRGVWAHRLRAYVLARRSPGRPAWSACLLADIVRI